MSTKIPWHKLPFVPGFLVGGVVLSLAVIVYAVLASGIFEDTVCEVYPWTNPWAIVAASTRGGGDCDRFIVKDVPFEEWPEFPPPPDYDDKSYLE